MKCFDKITNPSPGSDVDPRRHLKKKKSMMTKFFKEIFDYKTLGIFKFKTNFQKQIKLNISIMKHQHTSFKNDTFM